MAMTLAEATSLPVQAFVDWCDAHRSEVVGVPGKADDHVDGDEWTWANWECPGASFLADMIGRPVQVQFERVGAPGALRLEDRRRDDDPAWAGDFAETPAWLRSLMQVADRESGPITGERTLVLLLETARQDPREAF